MTLTALTKKLSVLALLLLLPLDAQTSSHAYVDELNASMARLVIRTSDKDRLNSLGFYAIRCSRLVDETIAMRNVSPSRKITVTEQDKPAADAGVVSYVNGEDELPFARRLLLELLVRRVEDMAGKIDRQSPFLQLVADGLTHRYVFGRRALSGYYEPDYEIARNQFMRHSFPQFDKLLVARSTGLHGALLRLHLMHADLLVAMLENTSSPAGENVKALLLAEQQGQNLLQTLDELTRHLRSEGESLQVLYQRLVLRAAQRQRRLSGEDVIEERVRQLESVPVVGLEATTAVKRIRLDDIPDVLKNYSGDKQGLFRLEQRFHELRLASPYLLRDALLTYAQAIAWLRNDNVSRFRQTIRQAREQFQKAMAKQRRVQEIMDDYQTRNTTAWQRFQDFILVIQRYQELADSLYHDNIFSKEGQ